MGHAADDKRRPPAARLDAEAAAKVAVTLQALATPSRLLILTRLREAPCAVTVLAEAIGMEKSAVSHQLRLLRNLGLVVGTRSGKSIIYSLYDDHVAMLLDQAVYHIEHLRLGISDAPAQAADSPMSWTIAEDPGAVLAAGQLRITAAGILRVRCRPRASCWPTGATRSQEHPRRSLCMSRVKRLTVVLLLNLSLVTSLVIVGLAAHSLAVLAAGADYLADAGAIGVFLLAIWLASRPPSRARPLPRRHQHRRAVNVGWLLVLNIAIATAAIQRLAEGTRRVEGLPGWEHPGQDQRRDPDRVFEVLWSVDPQVVRSAARIGTGLAATAARAARSPAQRGTGPQFRRPGPGRRPSRTNPRLRSHHQPVRPAWR